MARGKRPPTGPPRGPRYTIQQVTPRPHAYQSTPMDYRQSGPKLSMQEIAKLARRDGEILRAHGVTFSGPQQEAYKAKAMFEPERAEAVKAHNRKARQAQAPPEKPYRAEPAPMHQQRGLSPEFHEFMQRQSRTLTQASRQLSDKAKEFFQRKTPSQDRNATQQPQQQKEKQKDKDRDR